MLKKQTVWLLTMLSLVVVLSVYYITSPDGGMNADVAMMSTEQEEATQKETDQPADEPKEDEEGEKEEGENGENSGEVIEQSEDEAIISSVSSDDLFTAVRMELEDARNERKQELETIIGSNEASAEEKSKAYEEMQQLSDVTSKEKVLETLIKSKGYGDALVQADGEKVRITVKAEDHSKKKANEIIHLVKTEMNWMQDVAVTFHPAN
ncbi:SpoIIIAH-like family protein [Bacillus kexueae]|uniref:SpoIIIAH-like family protein n=1 Tax=Aeribacillus kexueae TaxID=2078952 RepID=UPI001FAEDC06